MFVSEVYQTWKTLFVQRRIVQLVISLCLSAEWHEDARDHQVHSPVPAEILHGEPGEPGSTAQEPQSVPEPWGTFTSVKKFQTEHYWVCLLNKEQAAMFSSLP